MVGVTELEHKQLFGKWFCFYSATGKMLDADEIG